MELASQISVLLEEPHASLIGSCVKAGVPYRSVQRWLAEDAEEGTEHERFQTIVLEAMERERVKDIEQMESDFASLDGPQVAKASALVNKHVHYHTNRFKRFYAEDEIAKTLRLEHTGKDGGPVASINVGKGISEQTRRDLVNKILGVPAAMIDAGEKLGELSMGDGESSSEEE